MVKKLSRKQAIPYGREGVSAFNYAFPDIYNGSSVITQSLQAFTVNELLGNEQGFTILLKELVNLW